MNVDLYLHVRVLISMILGLSVTRLVGGLAGFVQNPGRYRLSIIHLGWVCWTLLSTVSFWWWEFGLSKVEHWTFGLYLFVCVYASVFFFLSAVLFPGDLAETKSYEEYFLSRRAWIFGFIALIQLMDIGDTWVKGEGYFGDLGTDYPIGIAAYIVGSVIGALSKNRAVQFLLVVCALIYDVSFMARHYTHLT
jgi:hypothetical protein